MRAACSPFVVDDLYYDHIPRYFVYGGVCFQVLSKGFIEFFDSVSQHHYSSCDAECSAQREEIVFVAHVLSAELNEGYSKLLDSFVHSVNGERVRSLTHFIELSVLESRDAR